MCAKNCYCYIAILETIKLCTKHSSGSFENVSTKCVYKSYIFNI